MREIPFFSPALVTIAGLILCAMPVLADDDATIEAAKKAYVGGDFTTAIDLLKPLTSQDSTDDAVQTAKAVAASAHQRRGEIHFQNARIEESVADFDQFLKYYPDEAPSHWQRGISLYYAGEYQKGVDQFELHRTVNPEDVENAVWHFLCKVRAPGGSVEVAQKDYIPIQHDGRVPMMTVHKLFGGKAVPEDVLAAAAGGGNRAKFYADLYVGLYYEATGDAEQALAFIARAAENASANGYMGDVARVHLIVRDREAKAAKEKDEKP